MLRELEHPGAVRALIYLVAVLVAAVVVMSRGPSIVYAGIHTLLH